MKIFDAHFHIIDFNYPIIENNGYTPPEFTTENYCSFATKHNIVGGTIVSGSFQAFDQSYLKDSLTKLGSNYFGVASIPYDISDEVLESLNGHNVVAVRFNLKRGGSETVEHLEYLSNKLFERLGWYTELYVDSNDLKELKNPLSKLKRFSIDHLGLSKSGLKELYYWVERGTKVKATGFGRVDFDPIAVMKQIHRINPNALMFGTDVPSTRAKVPFSENHISLIRDNFNQNDQKRIFYQNALEWYQK